MSQRPKSALGLLCNCINSDNPNMKSPVTEESVAVKTLPVSVSVATYGRNSRVTLVGKPGSGLAGTLDFFFDRCTFSSLFYGWRPTVKLAGGVYTWRDIIPAVNEQLGLFLLEGDFTEAVLNTSVTVNAGVKGVSFATNGNAMCYTGTLTFNVTATPIGYYPNSGPGSKYLMAGDEQAGYFGDVASADLFTTNELYPSLTKVSGGPTSPAINNPYAYWAKFFWKGEIVYIGLTYAITWDWQSIYRNGFISSQPDDGVPPAGQDKVVQGVSITKRLEGADHTFRVRIPRVSDIDPMKEAELDPNNELRALLRKVMPVTWSGTGEWNDTTANRSPQSTIMLNTVHVDNGYVGTSWLLTADGLLGGQWPKTFAGQVRLVLEWVNPAHEPIPLGPVTASTDAQAMVPLAEASAETIEPLRWPTPPTAVNMPSAPVYTEVTSESIAPVVFNPVGVLIQDKQINAIASITEADTRLNLSDTNPELDGFL